MKTKIKTLLSATVCAALLTSCGAGGKIQLSDAQIQSGVSIGTGLALKFALQDPAKRTLVANYVSAIAGAARAATGTETAEELAKSISSRVPATVLAQVPEIGTIVIPQVVALYESARAQFGGDYKALYSRMNAVATGLEQGVSAWVSKT